MSHYIALPMPSVHVSEYTNINENWKYEFKWKLSIYSKFLIISKIYEQEVNMLNIPQWNKINYKNKCKYIS